MQEHNAQFRSLYRRSLEVLSPIPLEGSIPQVSHEARPKTGSEYIDDRWGIGEAQSTSVQLLNKRRQIVDDFEKQTSNDSNFIFLSKPYQGRSVWDSDYSSTRRRSLGSNTKRRGIVIPALKGTGYYRPRNRLATVLRRYV